jgi:hypothetical protein
MSKSLYLSRTNVFHPTTFEEAKQAMHKLFPGYSISSHNQNSNDYVPSKVTDAEVLFVNIDGFKGQPGFTIGSGVYKEIMRANDSYILYKRVCDSTWQIYEIENVVRREPKNSSSSNYATIRMGPNVTNRLILNYSVPPKLEDKVIVEIDLTYKSRRSILLTRKV